LLLITFLPDRRHPNRRSLRLTHQRLNSAARRSVAVWIGSTWTGVGGRSYGSSGHKITARAAAARIAVPSSLAWVSAAPYSGQDATKVTGPSGGSGCERMNPPPQPATDSGPLLHFPVHP
jgi:hypothetical protein